MRPHCSLCGTNIQHTTMLLLHHSPLASPGSTQQQRACRGGPAAAARRQPPLRLRRLEPVRASSQDPTSAAPTDAAAPAVPAAPPAGPSASTSSSQTRTPAAFNDSIPEAVFYEGSAGNAELLVSLLLAATLVFIPLTIQVVGKRLWIKYVFTNKRIKVINSSPVFAKEVQVSLKDVKEVRTAPRALGLWGDCVIFLKDGSRLEITGLESYKDIQRHIMSCIYD